MLRAALRGDEVESVAKESGAKGPRKGEEGRGDGGAASDVSRRLAVQALTALLTNGQLRFELIDAAAFLRAAGAPCAHVSLRSPPATLPSAATFGAACFLASSRKVKRGALVHTAAPLYFSAPMGLDCARHARRLLEETAAHKRSLVRYGAYALSDVVALLRYRPLGAAAQAELMPGVYSLIGMCTQVELQELHANSDPVGKRILADLLEGYQTSHKYRG
ncbi:hypothetical protein EMIHUDRAFT_197109 [Emiliania huxleyi CCMP1516]|uniref:Nucleolar 27S pre-rRNA processing Urb2/Npa2 C-terminal domain-containing protein n=2 Tax=Emiliania huxleyi TaxID=2903 RepID=A0A0D3ITQ0_EMIH1|nr:hypothetical protein EMIHUDRAFT_197109 [Emiliania huxleyi CCMP1516]EOD14635.1 hypothetical protein EMIHUDRAFT_197109 [Emiliania huxleyi CCMP1516]|eukprot:XP_005767064.1 hypothetical protein EMIHUDRAFT_197109 [Emiliania huxleyi CCMP1516]